MNTQEQLRDKVVKFLKEKVGKRSNLKRPWNPIKGCNFYGVYLRNYPEVLDLAFGPAKSSAVENKKKILQLKNRPVTSKKHPEERKLADAFRRYICKNDKRYDPEFDKLIRKTKPEWFIDTVVENQKKLLELKNRPSKGSKCLDEQRLANALNNYTRKKSNTYDPKFDKLIKKIKPQWFIDVVAEKKKILLKLNKRPSSSSKKSKERHLGRALSNYTCKTGYYYDSEFDNLIRKTKPEWFVDTASENKKRLLELKYRPNKRSKDPEERKLGIQLESYTGRKSSSYDLEFNKLIRRTRPLWFR